MFNEAERKTGKKNTAYRRKPEEPVTLDEAAEKYTYSTGIKKQNPDQGPGLSDLLNVMKNFHKCKHIPPIYPKLNPSFFHIFLNSPSEFYPAVAIIEIIQKQADNFGALGD